MTEISGVRSVAVVGRRVVDVLSSAFADDPWLHWTVPSPGAVRSLFSLFLRTVAVPSGLVLVAGPVDGGPVLGVAVVVPPEALGEPSPEVGAEVIALHGRRIGPALDADAVLDRHRPADPGWVLHSLAVEPGAQRRGLGTALVEEVVRRADGRTVTVETANPNAVALYRRQGFTVDHVVDLSAGWGLGADAPTVWLLSRTGDVTPPSRRP